MSDAEPAPTLPEEPPAEAPEELPEPVAAQVATCPICGHALDAHLAGGRCLIMLGEYGTEGPCPCPEPVAV